MAEKSFSEVPRMERELFEKGIAAVQRNNLDYALMIFNQVLSKEPGFYECREHLRATQMRKAGTGGGFFKKIIGGAGNSPQLIKAQVLLRSNPLEAIKSLEETLNNDPNNVSVHKTLAEAALAADLPKTAVLSLEVARKNAPKDQEVALRLAEALTVIGNISRAMNIYTELQKLNPADQDIAMAIKNLSASQTMAEGGYDQIGSGNTSYRDILKNKDEAVMLEQENRTVKAVDVAQRLIVEYEARLEKEPKNLKLRREIANLYTQTKNFDRALEYYNSIVTEEGLTDPTLEKEMSDALARKFDHELGQLDPAAPEYAERSAKIQAAKRDFLIDACKRRVEKYPQDLGIRFEMGVLYFNAGKITEAIQEFQKAQANPNRRIRAMSYLAQCYAARNMNDLAARAFQNALKEKVGFDDERKELIYGLGLVLDKLGKKEEAIEQFKQIYENDIGYRDVAARVDAYYSGN
jgi:tetratricopeptide (TPR) repeat protein